MANHIDLPRRCPYLQIRKMFDAWLSRRELMVFAAAFYGPDIAVAFITNDAAGFAAGQRVAGEAAWLAWQKQGWRSVA